MAQGHARSRQIALFVEGETERGETGRRTLPTFFHKWLDPHFPPMSKVGIYAVNFQGVSNYLDDLPRKLDEYLTDGHANFVVGLVDLYGLPDARIDLSDCGTVKEKVVKARREIRAMVPVEFRDLFRQHFAVHEVEAWLLAYPKRWPANVRGQIAGEVPQTDTGRTVQEDRPREEHLSGRGPADCNREMSFPEALGGGSPQNCEGPTIGASPRGGLPLTRESGDTMPRMPISGRRRYDTGVIGIVFPEFAQIFRSQT